MEKKNRFLLIWKEQRSHVTDTHNTEKKLVIFQLKSVKIGEEGADGCVRSDVVQMQVDCSQPDSRQNHYV